MTENFIGSTFAKVLAKVLATGVVVAACVGGMAVPASAAPVNCPSSTSKGHEYVGGGTLHVSNGVQLGTGWVTECMQVDSVELQEDAHHVPTKMVVSWDNWDIDVLASAAYPIIQDGKPTIYYVSPRVQNRTWVSKAWATCEIWAGKPGAGGEIQDRAPFKCETTQHGLDNDWDFVVEPSGN
jgi:hypothetical protein